MISRDSVPLNLDFLSHLSPLHSLLGHNVSQENWSGDILGTLSMTFNSKRQTWACLSFSYLFMEFSYRSFTKTKKNSHILNKHKST